MNEHNVIFKALPIIGNNSYLTKLLEYEGKLLIRKGKAVLEPYINKVTQPEQPR